MGVWNIRNKMSIRKSFSWDLLMKFSIFFITEMVYCRILLKGQDVMCLDDKVSSVEAWLLKVLEAN